MNYIRLELKAGRGGDGIISWAKTRYNSRLGPAGGSGGDGGNIYLTVDSKYSDFSHLRTAEKKAENGSNGQKDKKTGGFGSDIYLKVPKGIEIYDLEKKIRKSNLKKEEKFLICRGGRGGRGNSSFKNAQFQAPWLYELGEEGEKANILLIKETVSYIGIISLSEESLSRELATKLQELSSQKDQLYFFSFPFTIFEKEPIKHFYLKDLELCKFIILAVEFPNDNWEQRQEQLEKILKKLGFFSHITIFFSEHSNNIQAKGKEITLCSWKPAELKKIYQNLSKELKKITYLPCFKPSSFNPNDEYIEYSDELFPEKEDFQIVKTTEAWCVTSRSLQYWSSRIPQTTLHNIERLKTKLRVEEIIKQIKKAGGLKGETLKICNYTTSIY